MKTPEPSRPSRQEVAFLEALRRRCPAYEPILEALGHVYTQVGRYQDGLAVDLELTQRVPDDPERWYNLACSHALTGDPGRAMEALERAIACGYRDAAWMRTDPDLAALADHPAFRALTERLASAPDAGRPAGA